MTDKKRIILAIEHPIVVAGMRNLMQAEHDLEIAGSASTGLAALKLIQDIQPDLAVVDMSTSILTGIGLLRRITEQGMSVRILMLALNEDRALVHRALQAGAHGCVLKRPDPQQFIAAVRAVLAGGIYIDIPIAAPFFQSKPAGRGYRMADQLARELTGRETEVLKLAALGFSNKEIACQLDVGVKSVETYKARVSEKMGLKTRVDLVRHAILQGWLASA